MTATQSKNGLIVITGSGGLIGTHVQRELVSSHQVLGLDITEPEDPVEGAEWLKCDLTDDDSVRQALDAVREKFGTRIESVIHLAAYYDFSGEPSPMYEKLTVEGTRRLIRALQSFEVEQFVFSSSLLVMKPAEDDEPISEGDPTEAKWDYPRSKLETEKVLHAERGHIPVVILRLAGVYDEECHSVPVGQQIRRIYEKEMDSYFYPGDKHHGQAFIHLDDVASCVRRVVELRKELQPEELFLIAEPDVLSYEALQERLGELIHGKAWPSIRVPKPAAKAVAWAREKTPGTESFIKPWMIDRADDNFPVEIRRARQRLHWEPEHRLSQALEPMVTHLKEAPRHWYEVNNLPQPKDLEAVGAES